MLTGNKGEWSELYVLLKLLGDGELKLGNAHTETLIENVLPIIEVLRTENNSIHSYRYSDQQIHIDLGTKIKTIPASIFTQKALILLQAIKNNRERTFQVNSLTQFLDDIQCQTLKASSSTKTDINIKVYDPKTAQTPLLGFSIKSQLGSPSTLLNAGQTTNFIFQVHDLPTECIPAINAIDGRSKIKARIDAIMAQKATLQFHKCENETFSGNLILIDSLLPHLTAQLLLGYYAQGYSLLSELVTWLAQRNPLQFPNTQGHDYYTYKIKRFLTDIALGMMPSQVWTGQYDATGGYLVVKQSGEVLCYHLYQRNLFEDYLLHNTKLDTASTSRHQFGALYTENGQTFVKLNLQIRFTT